MDGTPEDCTRTLENESSTRNEFYNRPVTYANIPDLPAILTAGSWSRGAVSDPIWDSNYIPSIFVTGDPEEMEDLIENVPKTTYQAKITFIGPDQVNTFEVKKTFLFVCLKCIYFLFTYKKKKIFVI